MKITPRAIGVGFALWLAYATITVTQPPSPHGAPGSNPTTVAIAFALLGLCVAIACLHSRYLVLAKNRSVFDLVFYLVFAAVPIGLTIFGASTGWIPLIGRNGMAAYSVISSPAAYWSILAIYCFISTLLLSRAFAQLFNRSAP